MDLILILFLGVFIMAILCEFIDSSLGMLYGTILSPVLVIAGFDPILVIPSILISQAIGGFTASILHHRLKNADFSLQKKKIDNLEEKNNKDFFKKTTSQDLKVVFFITVLGVFAAVLAALIAVNIPKIFLKTYIGMIALIMGLIIISRVNFIFSWKKIIGIGILSSFNKAISGGGFGPIVTSGQVISGRNGKNSIGTTTLTEVPICIVSFLVYLITKGISNWNLIYVLSFGAIIGAIIGPFFTAKFKSEKKLKIILGVLTLALGIFVLIDTWCLKIKGISV